MPLQTIAKAFLFIINTSFSLLNKAITIGFLIIPIIFAILMLKLKIISFFLCLLLLMQILPIAQIGNMLSKSQWTEELPDANDQGAGKTDAFANYNHPYLPPLNSTTIAVFPVSKVLAYISHSEELPTNHSVDVVSPPPDVV